MSWFFKDDINNGTTLAAIAYFALKNGIKTKGNKRTWIVREVEVSDVPIGDWKITVERL